MNFFVKKQQKLTQSEGIPADTITSSFRDLCQFFEKEYDRNWNKSLDTEIVLDFISAIKTWQGTNAFNKKTESFLSLMSYKMTLRERQFLVDLLSKNVKVGVQMTQFFKIFQNLDLESALSIDLRQNLEAVFQKKINEPAAVGFPEEAMLSKASVDLSDLMKSLVKKNVRAILIEDKFDGERLQLHMSRFSVDSDFEYGDFLRNSWHSSLRVISLANTDF